jgi:preprotein translocase subunit SecB
MMEPVDFAQVYLQNVAQAQQQQQNGGTPPANTQA